MTVGSGIPQHSCDASCAPPSWRQVAPLSKEQAKVAMFVVRPLLNLAFRRFLTNLRRYTDERFATTRQD
jgi:hypothetical protein